MIRRSVESIWKSSPTIEGAGFHLKRVFGKELCEAKRRVDSSMYFDSNRAHVQVYKSKSLIYARETTSMPFLTKLMQDEQKVASYSFIHSISTSLGMSVYEDVSVIVARPHCESVNKKVDMKGTISKEQKSTITSIVTELVNGTRKVNKEAETK